MMATQRVLITGMSGLLGGALRTRLENRYDLTALNRRLVPGIRTHQADIADLESIRPAFQGQDTVVHLAGYRGYEWNDLLRTNIIGLYNVFEASREAEVSRIIFASSGASIAGWQRVDPFKAALEGASADPATPCPMLDHQTLPRPTGIYGCTKVWGEALAWDYSQAFDLSIICLRFGPITPTDRPTTPEMAHAWCSQRDAAQMVERCIEAPATLKFEIFNVISNNKHAIRDISHARETVGYEPLDSADQYVIDKDPNPDSPAV
jgi:nucleoside-diphosphate-sugar epimerase